MTGGAAGFTAKELYKMASQLQKVTKYGDEEILNKVTAQLLSFPKITGQVFKDAQKAVLDVATLLDGDVQASAIAIGKALQDPVKGITAMRRMGIMFSETQIEQVKNLVEQNKLYEAQQLILSEINLQYGGQAEAAAKSGLGALQQLKNTWGDFKEQMFAASAEGKTGGMFGWLKESLEYMTWGLAKIREEGGGFKKWWQWFWQTGEFGSDVFDAEMYGEANAEQISKNAAAIGIGGKEIKSYADMVNESLEANNKAAPVIEKTAEELEKEANAAKKAANELEKLRKEYRNLQDESMQKITGGISPITTDELLGSGAIPESQQKILDAMSTVGGSRITGMQLPVEQVEEMQMALRELPGTYATVTDEMEATSQRLKSAFESIGSALGNAIGEFIKGEAKFSDVATSLIQEIIKVVAGYLTESVAASFAGGASAGGPAAAFTGAAAAAAALSMFGAIVPALMAKGGTVPGGYPNDTYPALLSSGETVLPAPHKLDAMAGAQRVIVEGRIRGQDIYFVNEKQTSKLSRYR
jgi:hypothetical protein